LKLNYPLGVKEIDLIDWRQNVKELDTDWCSMYGFSQKKMKRGNGKG